MVALDEVHAQFGNGVVGSLILDAFGDGYKVHLLCEINGSANYCDRFPVTQHSTYEGHINL